MFGSVVENVGNRRKYGFKTNKHLGVINYMDKKVFIWGNF